jgi:hypothetical protein
MVPFAEFMRMQPLLYPAFPLGIDAVAEQLTRLAPFISSSKINTLASEFVSPTTDSLSNGRLLSDMVTPSYAPDEPDEPDVPDTPVASLVKDEKLHDVAVPWFWYRVPVLVTIARHPTE